MNYFEFYDLKPTFFIEDPVLKKKFLDHSRLFHPDHFALQSQEAQADAEDQSAFNNKAYKILSHPESRLKYLLELKDMVQEEEVYTLDQEFLMDMLDLNDLLVEDAVAAKGQLDKLEHDLYAEILPVLKSYDHERIHTEDLRQLKDYHYKKRYILRIRENLNKFASES